MTSLLLLVRLIIAQHQNAGYRSIQHPSQTHQATTKFNYIWRSQTLGYERLILVLLLGFPILEGIFPFFHHGRVLYIFVPWYFFLCITPLTWHYIWYWETVFIDEVLFPFMVFLPLHNFFLLGHCQFMFHPAWTMSLFYLRLSQSFFEHLSFTIILSPSSALRHSLVPFFHFRYEKIQLSFSQVWEGVILRR